MAKIYISSTYSDLKEQREAVYRALRQLGHDVKAMEDYVAADQRPQDRCLQDVTECEVYVGIIAWRYGYAPPADNPDGKSITELEYRKAREVGKTCLVFLLDPDAAWPLPRTDFHTGEGEQGKRIRDFRQELEQSVLRSTFKTTDELAKLVNTAVANWEREQKPKPPSPEANEGAAPQWREVSYSELLAYSPVDQDLARSLGQQLALGGHAPLLSPQALFAEQEADFQRLEKNLIQCHTALVVLSPAALDQLAPRAAEVRRILAMMRARTGFVGALLKDLTKTDIPAEWAVSEAWESAEVAQAIQRIGTRCPRFGTPAVGLPLMVFAMARAEVEALDQDPDLLLERLGTAAVQQFQTLRDELAKHGVDWMARYGAVRERWRPFGAGSTTIEGIVAQIVQDLNQRSLPKLRQRLVKAQSYPFDAVKERDPLLRRVYREIAQTGCVMIVDELSLFHPDLREALIASPFFNSEQVAVVTVAPFDTVHALLNQLLESETRQRLAGAFDRFALDYDPQCEFAVGDERRLKRWLHASLPETLRTLREPRPDRNSLRQFALEVGIERSGVGDVIWSEGGRE